LPVSPRGSISSVEASTVHIKVLWPVTPMSRPILVMDAEYPSE
jgi:hypothetical protein